MTQPQFADGPPVPLMTEGVLDVAGLDRLVSDLTGAAEVTGVIEKTGAGVHADTDERPLVAAIHRLRTGATRAVQVRYRYGDHDWTDTILTTPAGFRVVRCRHET